MNCSRILKIGLIATALAVAVRIEGAYASIICSRDEVSISAAEPMNSSTSVPSNPSDSPIAPQFQLKGLSTDDPTTNGSGAGMRTILRLVGGGQLLAIIGSEPGESPPQVRQFFDSYLLNLGAAPQCLVFHPPRI